MTKTLITISASLLSVFVGFSVFAAKAQASYYYDESYYNWPTPCYQYDGYGHCISSGYRNRSTYNRRNTSYNNSYYNAYPYATSGYYRPVDNYYRSSQNRGCYWYYGSYRCDDRDCD